MELIKLFSAIGALSPTLYAILIVGVYIVILFPLIQPLGRALERHMGTRATQVMLRLITYLVNVEPRKNT